MAGYYYLVSYDFTINDSEILSGYQLIERNAKITQEKNVAGTVQMIIEGIESRIREELLKNHRSTQKRIIKVIPKNIQLLD